MKCPACQQPTNQHGYCRTGGCKFIGQHFDSAPGQHAARSLGPVANYFGSPLEQAMFSREFLDTFRDIADALKALSTRVN